MLVALPMIKLTLLIMGTLLMLGGPAHDYGLLAPLEMLVMIMETPVVILVTLFMIRVTLLDYGDIDHAHGKAAQDYCEAAQFVGVADHDYGGAGRAILITLLMIRVTPLLVTLLMILVTLLSILVALL